MNSTDELTPQNARVAIAQDVLVRLDAHLLVPNPGQYIADDGDCQVCALGALFACAVPRGDFDNAKKLLTVGPQMVTIRSALEKVFDSEQLDLIECAFERDPTFWEGEFYAEEADDAVEFGREHDNHEDRLRAICQNIVANGGTFRP